MKQPREIVAQWLGAVNDEGRGLTEWEKNFVTDVADHFDSGGNLSEKQLEVLERIYVEKVP